ncbi:MAG: hypothetical protein ABIK89_17665, partial [Planctomycetota bacterium]
ALLLPEDAKLPPEAAEVVRDFRQRGGRFVAAGPTTTSVTGEQIAKTLKQNYRISPPSPHIAMGRFLRDGRQILLIVNASGEAYQGSLSTDSQATWQLLNPAAGTVETADGKESGQIQLELAGRQSLLLVCERTTSK